ncbi:MAG: nucleotidyltransferase domain-containing protein [Chloroflexi bacterium]|nr:nucleotidyltransferase domain-containing protein [Chloroflexota bacterium]
MQTNSTSKIRVRLSPSEKRRRLLQRELKRWLPLLIENFKPERIIVFGSFAANRVSEWSDVDLVIVHKTNLPFLQRAKAAMLLTQPKVGVDFLIYSPQEFSRLSKERPFFREEILNKGRVLYELR